MSKNNGIANELRQWFISMGYPLDEVDVTDWNALCCGRLPVFWNKCMKSVKPKKIVDNIRRNILLKEIEKFSMRENSSATKLGFVLPPLQIHYANEQKKLSEKLSSIQADLERRKKILRRVNVERKQKCHKLNEIKNDIMIIAHQTYIMKIISQKLRDNIEQFNEIFTDIKNFNGSFKNPIENLSVKKEDFVSFQKYLLFNLEKKPETTNENYSIDEIDSTNNSINATVIHNNEHLPNTQINIDKKETFELLRLIHNYHMNIPDIIDENISSLFQAKYKEIESCKNSGELATYSDSLAKLDLAHVQIVIKTLKIKKDINKVKKASSHIKSQILTKLSGHNVSKIQSFHHQCCSFSSNEYKRMVCKELADLKAKTGYYSIFNNLDFKDVISTATLEDCKKSYLESRVCCERKLKNILLYVNKLQHLNENISKYVKQMKKNTSSEKVLWDSENESMQEIYMKVILNNPSAFKFEKDNAFESFIHLREILTEFNFSTKLQETANLMSDELQNYKIYNTNDTMFLFERSHHQDEKLLQQLEISKKIMINQHMEYLRPIEHFMCSFIKSSKFLSSLYKFVDLKYNASIYKTCLGNYLENGLVGQEEALLFEIEDNFPNIHTTTITKPFFDDFYDTYDFYINYSKRNDIGSVTPEFM